MEVAGSKAQAGAGIQALLQTDLNTSMLQGHHGQWEGQTDSLACRGRGLGKYGEGWAREGLAPRQTQHLCVLLD